MNDITQALAGGQPCQSQWISQAKANGLTKIQQMDDPS